MKEHPPGFEDAAFNCIPTSTAPLLGMREEAGNAGDGGGGCRITAPKMLEAFVCLHVLSRPLAAFMPLSKVIKAVFIPQ